MTRSRQNLGKFGEARAAEHLLEYGYAILGKNVRTPYGEIDIVASKGPLTVFVEVKTRRSHTFGYPEESVTELKQERMMLSAQAYLQTHPELDGDWQIDVIAIEVKNTQSYKVVHFPNAISG